MMEADHRPSAKGLSVALELAAVIPLRGPVITPRPYVVRAAAGSSNLPPSTWSRCFSRALCPGEYYLQPFFTRACWRGFGTALTRPGISRYGTIVTAAFAARVLSKYVGVLSALRRQLRSSASGRRPLRPPCGGGRGRRRLSLSASSSGSPRCVSCFGGCPVGGSRVPSAAAPWRFGLPRCQLPPQGQQGAS
jgi:hypothetical protein